jgi:hypothetical protein
MFLAMDGDAPASEARCLEALDVQQRLGDAEGIGLSTSALASLALARKDYDQALEWYRKSLAAFEACRDRAEEARVLAEMAWTHLANNDGTLARWYFFESVQAYTDVVSVRGVGLSLIGLAAVEAFEGRVRNAVVISAAAEVYAHQEGIVNVYGDENTGRSYIDQARAALAADELGLAEALGRRMPISEVLDLARADDDGTGVA